METETVTNFEFSGGNTSGRRTRLESRFRYVSAHLRNDVTELHKDLLSVKNVLCFPRNVPCRRTDSRSFVKFELNCIWKLKVSQQRDNLPFASVKRLSTQSRFEVMSRHLSLIGIHKLHNLKRSLPLSCWLGMTLLPDLHCHNSARMQLAEVMKVSGLSWGRTFVWAATESAPAEGKLHLFSSNDVPEPWLRGH